MKITQERFRRVINPEIREQAIGLVCRLVCRLACSLPGFVEPALPGS
jgi:hypothetical protein